LYAEVSLVSMVSGALWTVAGGLVRWWATVGSDRRGVRAAGGVAALGARGAGGRRRRGGDPRL